ncbi:hypothetical protein [Virgibacillus proomii]|uniref:hypothetical protein n=1 Tax=Virgibacillus proomii TaxID=84407 RepID=UPI001C11F773|nr:hypothetical protein [Virgibacillus proomii]MBU5266532.1 hypothetical protein [Virgibacillus proomii]
MGDNGESNVRLVLSRQDKESFLNKHREFSRTRRTNVNISTQKKRFFFSGTVSDASQFFKDEGSYVSDASYAEKAFLFFKERGTS